MNINWKVRIKNPVFWAQVAVAIVAPITCAQNTGFLIRTGCSRYCSAYPRRAWAPVGGYDHMGGVRRRACQSSHEPGYRRVGHRLPLGDHQ